MITKSRNLKTPVIIWTGKLLTVISKTNWFVMDSWHTHWTIYFGLASKLVFSHPFLVLSRNAPFPKCSKTYEQQMLILSRLVSQIRTLWNRALIQHNNGLHSSQTLNLFISWSHKLFLKDQTIMYWSWTQPAWACYIFAKDVTSVLVV